MTRTREPDATGPRTRTAVAVMCGAIGGSVIGATPLGAHTGGRATSFGDGLSHPLGGPDHLLAMFAVGILAVVAARRCGRPLWVVPATFVAAMVAGGAAGLGGVVSEPFEPVVVGSVVALGVAIGVTGRWAGSRDGSGVALALVLVAVAGLAHGHAHGVEAGAGTHAMAYVVGFVAATVGLHAAGAFTATAVRSRPAGIAGLAAVITTAGAALLI